jgi:hypothetical protein
MSSKVVNYFKNKEKNSVHEKCSIPPKDKEKE